MDRLLASAFLLCLCSSVSMAEAPRIGWHDLVDAQAQSFEDPYADLTSDQVAELGTVVGTRAMLQDAALADEERTRAQARLSSAEAALAGDGIDVDWLLGQRWVVAERREKAATSVNADVDGKTVSLSGFAIPAPPDPDGTPTAYLVPERGMCSHMPPPNPNQMIRVRLNGQWIPSAPNEPVRLSGRLRHSPSQRELQMVDGPVQMKSSFSMDVTDVQTAKDLRGETAAPGGARH
jgi:hypothetical protein